jgi:nitrite reductase/ring-hydroxylating ferredoxin subunit
VPKIKIPGAAELADGATIKFPFTRNNRSAEGFVARFQGKLVAYENLCRHLPMHLDYDSGRIFTREGDYFMCQTHGAMYEPLTGKCVRGPCQGEKLKAIHIEIVGGEVWADV